MDEQINQALEDAASEEFLEALIDLAVAMEPSLEDAHAAMTWLLADIMVQMQPDESNRTELVDFTISALREAMDFHEVPDSATIN